jgi:hypothetical protein
MPRMLAIVVVAGLISGLLVGGFHNLFTVPVIERAIALEEERAAVVAGNASGNQEEEAPLVSLGVQRWGMAVGTGIYGVILGLVFAGGYALLRRFMPQWRTLALALTTGALGFWALSLFPFIRFPLNPPGVGEETTLTYRQGYQALFMVLSAAGAAGLLVALERIKSRASQATQRMLLYGFVLVTYAVFAVIIVFSIPSNPDPVQVPVDLLELYRTLTMVGQFLQWALLAFGVAVALTWYERSAALAAKTLSRGIPASQ